MNAADYDAEFCNDDREQATADRLQWEAEMSRAWDDPAWWAMQERQALEAMAGREPQVAV